MKRILVIEDDQDIAEIVELALTDKYIVEIQTDNELVTASFNSFKPDLVMIDNHVGQKQAPEIVDEIKRLGGYKTVPFVLFSGHHDIKSIAAKMEASAYLPKPFALFELYNCIDLVFSKTA